MLAFCRSLAVIALGLAVTASAAQERGSRDADVNNSHEDTRQHVSEHREQSGVLALLPGDSVTEHSIDLPSGGCRHADGAFRQAPHRARTAGYLAQKIASRKLMYPSLMLNEKQFPALLCQLNSSSYTLISSCGN